MEPIQNLQVADFYLDHFNKFVLTSSQGWGVIDGKVRKLTFKKELDKRLFQSNLCPEIIVDTDISSPYLPYNRMVTINTNEDSSLIEDRISHLTEIFVMDQEELFTLTNGNKMLVNTNYITSDGNEVLDIMLKYFIDHPNHKKARKFIDKYPEKIIGLIN